MKRIIALALTATAITTVGAAPAQAASAKMITLTVADNGRHIRVPRGEHVMVRLSVAHRRTADLSTWWRPIAERGRALQARPVGTMTARGVTAGHYYAAHRGESALSSARAACPASDNHPTCFAMQGWSVTVDVR
jgi:hypothetical protein